MDSASVGAPFPVANKEEGIGRLETEFTIKAPMHVLDLGEVYAVQLNYEYQVDPFTGATRNVFSAREAYVWPSASALKPGDRVASFPLRLPLPRRTYSYIVCEDTFPSGRETAWKNLIRHAFDQWEVATSNWVTLDPVTGDCADYEPFVARIRNDVKAFATSTLPSTGSLPTDDEIAAHARELLKNFDQNQIGVTRRRDTAQSEVLMIDDRPTGANSTLVKVRVFPEVAATVGHGTCSAAHIACAFSPQRWAQYRGLGEDDPPVVTADIRLRRSKFGVASLVVPTSAVPGRFNSCGPADPELYNTLVHEAGHALGIAYGTEGKNSKRDHPQLEDSVMKDPLGIDERGERCSPYPIDVMAIYALYQSVPR